MQCAFDLCVYEKEGQCTLKDIFINSYGMCDECICVDIEKAPLHLAKMAFFQKCKGADFM